jgi:50S ribosomal subunit-associated GTPase HflX
LGLDETPLLTVFNKQDKVAPQLTQNLCRLYDAIAIEARNPTTLAPLIARMRSILWEQFPLPRRYVPKAEGTLEAAAVGGLG